MEHIYHSTEELVGHTPLLEVCHIEKEEKLKARVLVKIEGKNPGGSAKDRVAKQMLDDAEASGLLQKDSVIIEPTSGNTGIGLALFGAVRGYRSIIIMPDSMSKERIMLLEAFGAEVILTPGAEGMKGCISKAESLAKELPNSFIPGQFTNPSNPKAHYETTGPEIWQDTDGHVDAFVAGIGTGGTITGTGRYLKEKKKELHVVGIEPATSPLISKGTAGKHGLQGIGANFIPDILDRNVIDEIVTVSDEEAYAAGRLLAKKEGILSGITSGAALSAAISLAKREEYAGKTIVALLPDTGDRYLSTPLFKD